MDFSGKEIDSLLLLLNEKKQELEILEAESNIDILLEFLHRSQLRKEEELHEVSASYLYHSCSSGTFDLVFYSISVYGCSNLATLRMNELVLVNGSPIYENRLPTFSQD